MSVSTDSLITIHHCLSRHPVKRKVHFPTPSKASKAVQLIHSLARDRQANAAQVDILMGVGF